MVPKGRLRACFSPCFLYSSWWAFPICTVSSVFGAHLAFVLISSTADEIHCQWILFSALLGKEQKLIHVPKFIASFKTIKKKVVLILNDQDLVYNNGVLFFLQRFKASLENIYLWKYEPAWFMGPWRVLADWIVSFIHHHNHPIMAGDMAEA